MHQSSQRISPDRFDAVLFDLDGVLTQTAKVHAACWKSMFDEFLKQRAHVQNEPFQPFDIATDYALYVDGKPRFEGVRSFLESRNIHLPDGDPDSPPNEESTWGLGNRKNEMVNEHLKSHGVEAYPGSVAFVRGLRSKGIRSAVVSSSANCERVLAAAKISHFFDAVVDGGIAARLKLVGKPAPDTYLAAAKQLGVSPQRAVVVEDAIAGVKAGRNGGFGLIVGVDRKGDTEALVNSGADIVVKDLNDLLD